MPGRLFQRFQKGVECRLAQHVYLINDVHLKVAHLRSKAHLVNQVADVVNRVVGSRIQLVNVQRLATLKALARIALTTRLNVLAQVLAVELVIDNELQEKELMAERQDLMNFLRERLNNYHFDIVPRVADSPEEKKLYTSQDKYLRMVEKNPLLKDLKQRLDLDYD